MAALSRNAPCPCGSGRKAKACCGPVLDGGTAPTAEALMRSRYVAYAVRDVAHVMATTAPESPHRRADPAAWRVELLAFCDSTRFDRLEVRWSKEDGDRAQVEFYAHLVGRGGDVSFGERSQFVRRDGHWLYVSGEPSAAPR